MAVATALSGYQAAIWDGESAKEYATSSRLRSESVQQHLESTQIARLQRRHTQRLARGGRNAGDEELKRIFEKRFTPEYEEAFQAWIALDPFQRARSPRPARASCLQYEDPVLAEADELDDEASHAFDLGVEFRKTGERYVRVTVLLAAVLFLIAIGQRFKIRGVRYAVNIVAGVLLVYALYLFAIYPHIWAGA